MTDQAFVSAVRSLVAIVDTGHEATAKFAADEARALLAERGLASGCHVGRKDLANTVAMVEWYAGQLVSIVDAGQWWALNAWVNCGDKFAPVAMAGGE